MDPKAGKTSPLYPTARKVALVVLVAGAVNFALFSIIALRLGGDGLSGKVENSHYFFGNHGRYTEVSPGLYHYSRLHAVFTMALHPFIILCAMIFGSIRWGELQQRRRQTPGPGDERTPPP